MKDLSKLSFWEKINNVEQFCFLHVVGKRSIKYSYQQDFVKKEENCLNSRGLKVREKWLRHVAM